jgi:hypothetical protein
MYYEFRYLRKERKYGVTWQYKSASPHCGCCGSKFATIALRKSQAKKHCRMCGRIVCRACSPAMLFYAASGKRQRTCVTCIEEDGPPADRAAVEAKQKSIFTLMAEAKAKAGDSKSDGKKAKGPTPPREKRPEKAQWADWGLPDGQVVKKSTFASLFSGAEKPSDFKFTFFLPPQVLPFETIEVPGRAGSVGALPPSL